MEFLTTTNRKQRDLSRRLGEVADSMERHGRDAVNAVSARAVKWLVGYIREVAAELVEAADSRPDSFIDRPVVIYGRELELLQSLAEDQWLDLSNYEFKGE